jgi:hypothetical protein
MPEERLCVILNGVNECRLKENGLNASEWEPGLDSSRPSVLFVGSLIKRKGIDVLIRATAIGREWDIGWNLLIVGDGPERTSLQILSENLGIADRVAFAEERSDVGRLLSQFSDAIYVSAAREEMLPLNLIEAMTFGLPVVASDIPAHHEALGPSAGGYFAVDQPEVAAQSIASLLCDEVRRQRSSVTGRERARDLFSIDRFAAEFAELYKGLVSIPRWHYSVLGGIRWPRCYNDWFRSVLSIRAKSKGLLRQAPHDLNGPNPHISSCVQKYHRERGSK